LTAYYCWESDDHWALFIAIYQLMTLFVIPALLMIICYFRVIKELWASTKVITILTTPSHNSNGIRVHKDGQSYLVRWPSKRLASISINCQSCRSNSSNNTNSSYNNRTNNNNNHNHYINTNIGSHSCRSPVTHIRNARKQVYHYFV